MKASHIRFSQKQYERISDAMDHREHDRYLKLADIAEAAGNTQRALVLREVAIGALPRRWAMLH
jgi:hypothetical protein